MDSDDKALMEELGITSEVKTIFHYAGYRYEQLSDAVNYAKTRPKPAPQPNLEHEN